MENMKTAKKETKEKESMYFCVSEKSGKSFLFDFFSF